MIIALNLLRNSKTKRKMIKVKKIEKIDDDFKIR
jgi:hypothetical protein